MFLPRRVDFVDSNNDVEGGVRTAMTDEESETMAAL